jgi:hypothetical protein
VPPGGNPVAVCNYHIIYKIMAPTNAYMYNKIRKNYELLFVSATFVGFIRDDDLLVPLFYMYSINGRIMDHRKY